MRIFKAQNVFDAALDRIRYLYDEFENIIVSFSGGKDSTVIFNLTLRVAREKGRLPLKVLFLDQEAEWQATINMVKKVMYHPDVEPKWYQVPIKLLNATSTTENWLYCWEPGRVWLREKDPVAIKENIYGTDRFGRLFIAITHKEYPTLKTANIGGVRAEESPGRFMSLTYGKSYKWVTWGITTYKKQFEHYTFYPIYDWSYTDVWKAIHSNGWEYCKIYDYMYNHGVPVRNMRVSNVHHESAVNSLFYLQEMESETYGKLVDRLSGIDMAGKFGKDQYFVHDLPPMFGSWMEYRDYLLDKLISDESWKEKFKKAFERHERDFGITDETCRLHVSSILTNDCDLVHMKNWEASRRFRKKAKGGEGFGYLKTDQKIV